MLYPSFLSIRHIFVAALLTFVFGMAAATSPASGDTTENKNDTLHQQLRDVRDTMQTALNQGDLDTLLQHVTDDVVFTTMNGDRVIGKTGIKQYFQKMTGGEKPIVKSIKTHFEAEALSHLYGSNTAVSFGHSNDHYQLSSGDTWTVTPQWSATLVQKNGKWLIANFHYSVNMFDNPILSAQRTWLLIAAAAAALLALIAGFFAGRKLR